MRWVHQTHEHWLSNKNTTQGLNVLNFYVIKREFNKTKIIPNTFSYKQINAGAITNNISIDVIQILVLVIGKFQPNRRIICVFMCVNV